MDCKLCMCLMPMDSQSYYLLSWLKLPLSLWQSNRWAFAAAAARPGCFRAGLVFQVLPLSYVCLVLLIVQWDENLNWEKWSFCQTQVNRSPLFLCSSLIIKSLQWSYSWCMTFCHLKGWINISNAKSPTKDQSYSTKICWKSGVLNSWWLILFCFI